MLIDVILDRRAGDAYDAREFYNYLQDAGSIFSIYWDVARAMDEGTEDDVKAELCRYIEDGMYNPTIADYIRSVDWLISDR